MRKDYVSLIYKVINILFAFIWIITGIMYFITYYLQQCEGRCPRIYFDVFGNFETYTPIAFWSPIFGFILFFITYKFRPNLKLSKAAHISAILYQTYVWIPGSYIMDLAYMGAGGKTAAEICLILTVLYGIYCLAVLVSGRDFIFQKIYLTSEQETEQA